MVGTVGNDAFANSLRSFLADNDVDCTGVREVDGPATGVAIIQVAEGDNAITVASGANLAFHADGLRQSPATGEIWVAQFETPVEETALLMAKARAAGARTVLNLAPYQPVADDLLAVVDVAILNEIELSQASGLALDGESALDRVAAACRALLSRGPGAVVATLGARGAVVVAPEAVAVISALPAAVVDTTGAGDCFVGTLAARLALGDDLVAAARHAAAASSLCVEKLGAAPAMPTGDAVAARLARA